MIKYLKLLISVGNEASMKRFIVFVISIHFMITAFCVLFGVLNLAVDKDLLKEILETDKIVILVGLGVIGISNVADVIAARIGKVGSYFSRSANFTEEFGPSESAVIDPNKSINSENNG